MEDLERHSLPKALSRKYLKRSILACSKTDKGDYCVEVDWWCKEARTIKVIIQCKRERTVL
jgi:hypothetical protein